MPFARHVLALVTLALLAACGHMRSTEPPPILILVSIDGMRMDYLDRGVSPTLSRLRAEGASARMRPSFPTSTFPNHYTLVTGLRPDHHGIVNNYMETPERPGVRFTLSNAEVSHDPIWWNDATPIWVTLERAGVRTGTMFWPGSEVAIHDTRPSRWMPYDEEMTGDQRVDTLLSWLDLPDAERPRFFTLYFDIVDTQGHDFGPDAPETTEALARTDASVARLLAGLRTRGLEDRVNLLIVSDHGMTAISEDRIIDLDAMAPAALGRIIWDSATAGVTALPGQEAALEAAMVGRRAHGECWAKRDLPARLEYGTHRRVPSVICIADRGWRYRTTTFMRHGSAPDFGGHGFDNAEDDMLASFIGYGPAFRPGAQLPVFDNVSVYPLLAHLTGVAPLANDGNLGDTRAALRRGRAQGNRQ